jgi:hypothetical protein
MKLQNDPVGQRAYDAIKGSPEGSIATMEYNFPKPGTDKPVLKESHRGAHRQSGLRRELLQIASKERSAKNINDDASSTVEYKQTNWPTFDANAHSYPRIPTDHTLQTGPHSPAP